MKLTDFYNEVSRRVDTAKTQINVAETKRVLAVSFEVMSKLDSGEALDLLAKGVAQANKKKKK